VRFTAHTHVTRVSYCGSCVSLAAQWQTPRYSNVHSLRSSCHFTRAVIVMQHAAVDSDDDDWRTEPPRVRTPCQWQDRTKPPGHNPL